MFKEVCGRKYIVVPLLLKPVGEKIDSIEYSIVVPKKIAKRLYDMTGRKPDEELPVIVLVAPASWYHVIDWMKNIMEQGREVIDKIPRKAREELCCLGLIEKKYCR